MKQKERVALGFFGLEFLCEYTLKYFNDDTNPEIVPLKIIGLGQTPETVENPKAVVKFNTHRITNKGESL